MESQIDIGNDGLYSLCVYTQVHIPEEEVREVFSEFGSIVKIHSHNDKTLFVRFNNREDAVSCFRGMRNNTKYRVNPAICKKRPSGFEDMNQSGGDDRRRSAGGDRRNGGGDDWGSAGEDRRRSAGEDRRRSAGDDRRRGGGDDRGSAGEDRRRNGVDDRQSFGRPGFRGDGDGLRNGEASNRGLPPLVPAGYVHSTEETEITGSRKQAKAVIVGNLPPGFKQANVYELCLRSRVSPLHVAMKNANHPGYPKTYYAFVFVKTEEDVRSLVLSLNELKLKEGPTLLVKSADTLEEEGRALQS